MTGPDADCVQWGTDPCPRSSENNGTMGPATMIMASNLGDEDHPDGRIAAWAAKTLTSFAKDGVGVKGGAKPFFLAVGLHKPHLPHIVPKKYFVRRPATSSCSTRLPPSPSVLSHSHNIPKVYIYRGPSFPYDQTA